jgi:hypothetical protein
MTSPAILGGAPPLAGLRTITIAFACALVIGWIGGLIYESGIDR